MPDISKALRARRVAALNRVVCANGRYIPRHQLVDEKVALGYRVEPNPKDGRRLSHPDGRYLPESAIGKTAMDYAEEKGNAS